MDIWKRRFLNLVHYKDLVHELITRDLKLKYRRSILGKFSCISFHWADSL